VEIPTSAIEARGTIALYLSKGTNMAGINITHGVSRDPDFVIDEIVARCSDDVYGALKALLLINEHLEAELSHLRGATAYARRAARRTNFSLH
jgi:hypothetical protein